MVPFNKLLMANLLAAALVFACFAKTPLGSISVIVGDAFIRHDGDSAWTKAKIKAPVYENDAVALKEESRCEIALGGDKIVRLGEKTVAIISEKSGSQAKVKALMGSVWINAKHLLNNKTFDVVTPTAVAGIRGTVFCVRCDTNTSDCLVFRGAVAIARLPGNGLRSRDSTFLVTSGERFTFVKNMGLYLKQQEDAIKDYLQQSGEELDKFDEEQQEQFDDYEKDFQEQMDAMLAEERGAFKSMDDINYALRPIEEKKLAHNAWIEWNRARDKEVGW
jgi:hypothetical protein